MTQPLFRGAATALVTPFGMAKWTWTLCGGW